jgi:2-isopropylmalate synthase
LRDTPLFARPVPRLSSEVRYHHDCAPGTRFLALDESLIPGAPLYLAVRRVASIPVEQPEYVEVHAHSVDSLYVLLGDGPGLTGLSAIVRWEGGQRRVDAPMTVLIPRGLAHSYKLTSGTGTYLSVVLAGDYNSVTSQQVGLAPDGAGT